MPFFLRGLPVKQEDVCGVTFLLGTGVHILPEEDRLIQLGELKTPSCRGGGEYSNWAATEGVPVGLVAGIPMRI